MFIETLKREMRVCAQADCAKLLGRQPDHWNVISIRESKHPEPRLIGARRVHRLVFEDVVTEGDSGRSQGPREAHLQAILRFADHTAGEPLLVHCWAGRSRSTAAALVLIVRSLWEQGESGPVLIRRAIDLLLAVRPQAVPNPFVLRLGLQVVLPHQLAQSLAKELVQEPRITANRIQP